MRFRRRGRPAREFLLDGAYVDDVPMARDLTNTEGDR
jgi:hypothetical protein